MDNSIGDQQFADLLVERASRLVPLARRLADGENGRDLMQDVLERAWRARRDLRSSSAIDSWLRSALLNRARDAHRRGALLTFTSLDALSALPAAADHHPADALVRAEHSAALRVALRSLPAAELLAVVLCDAEGWPAVDVATAVHASPAAVHKRLQRGRRRLRAALGTQHGAIDQGVAVECGPVLALAAQYLDGALGGADVDRVERHLAVCVRCPPLVQVLRQLRDAFSGAEASRAVDRHTPAVRAAVRRLSHG